MESSLQLPIIRIAGDSAKQGSDLLAIEEPLEIRLAFQDKMQNIAVTMRTPGNDTDLALGFLFTEGIIGGPADVKGVDPFVNTILVTLNAGVMPDLRQAQRNFYTTSSCGVCGKASIDAIRTVHPAASPTWDREVLDAAFILSLPERLVEAQKVFAETGGLHAAALFDLNGSLLLVREDVGRHNAVDKLVGAAMMAGRLPLATSILLLSGRASFELVQKAAMAGIQVIAAVGAPSTLAVSLADEFGITLIGFLRSHRFNIYSGACRINVLVKENIAV